MIQNEQTAQKISDLMQEIGAKLNDSVALVQCTGTSQELAEYRAAVGQLMGVMLLDIMDPVYALHPSLRPSQLD